MEKLKTAVVGYGGMGGHHIERLASSEKFDVVGIYDIDPERGKVAAENGLKVYSSREEIVQDGVRAVIVAVPNDVHAEYVTYFASNGVGVLCEKPVMMSSKELEKVAKAVRGKGVFAINQNRRFDNDFLTVKKIIADDTLCGVYRIESRVVGGNGIPGGWRKLKEHGGGMMLDWGVHLIDQALLMTDSKIKSVYCTYSYATGYKVDDAFNLELTFDNGLEYNIVVETNTFIPMPRWRVYGYGGTAEITTWDLKGKIVKPKPLGDAAPAGMVAGNGFTKTMAYKLSSETETLALPEITPNPSGIYDNFFDAIVNGAPVLVTESQALRVMRVMEAAAKAADSGKVVKTSL